MIGSRFVRAVERACERHAGQVRKGTSMPYISHLLAVASLVLEARDDEDLAIAALLHDAIEDRPEQASPDDIRAEFGKRRQAPSPYVRDGGHRYAADHLAQVVADGVSRSGRTGLRLDRLYPVDAVTPCQAPVIPDLLPKPRSGVLRVKDPSDRERKLIRHPLRQEQV